MTKKQKIFNYIFFAAAVVLFLLLASRSSFLYVFNNWDDANSYFSVGKGIFNGKMPYRDIFDQKGMYLYFLYGLAYLVSHTTFTGVFILEAVLGFFDVLGFYKLIRTCITENGGRPAGYVREMLAVILAPLPYVVTVSSRSFWWGGAAEEICLPFYIWGLYISVRYFRNIYPKKSMPLRDVFIGGVLAGMVANIKFTGLGFFFAWMMMVFFSYLALSEFAQGIKACFIFLLGMFVTFIPWIIYFGVQGGLFEWYWGYVYVNVFVYTKVEGASAGLTDKVRDLAKILYWLIRDDWQYFVFVIAGMLYSILQRGGAILSRLNVPVLFGFMFLGFFGGGRELPYYSLPLSVFSVFGFCMLALILISVFGDGGKKSMKKMGAGYAFWPIVCTALSLVFIYFNSMNIPFMKQDADSYFLFRFRDKILQTENPTLLNVGCLDAGLYTLCDIVPSCRWFQTQTLNIDEPENDPYKEQDRYVREGLTDYVVGRDYFPESIDKRYELIDSEVTTLSGVEHKYSLYKRVD